QHLGFSLGVSQAYTPDVIVSSEGSKALSFTSVLPQLYLNFSKKKFDFRLIYGITYNHFENGMSNLDKTYQNGTTTFNYTIIGGRKRTLQFSNAVTSTYYDPGAFIGNSFSTPSAQSLTPQLYPDRRRETRELASISLSYAITRKGSVTASVNDQFA